MTEVGAGTEDAGDEVVLAFLARERGALLEQLDRVLPVEAAIAATVGRLGESGQQS